MIDPNDYWVNNPLITPINKALMYDNAIFMAKMDMRDDIVELLKDRWVKSMDENSNITAMGLPVDRKSAMLVTEALIWAVEQING